MSKKRKTKKEKMIASSRRTILESPKNTLEYSNIPIAIPKVVTSPKSQNTQTYGHSYVLKDVKNTLLITAILAALNIILFLVLKFKLINIGIAF